MKLSKFVGYIFIGSIALAILGDLLSSSCTPCGPCPQGYITLTGIFGAVISVPLLLIVLIVEGVSVWAKKSADKDKNQKT